MQIPINNPTNLKFGVGGNLSYENLMSTCEDLHVLIALYTLATTKHASHGKGAMLLSLLIYLLLCYSMIPLINICTPLKFNKPYKEERRMFDLLGLTQT